MATVINNPGERTTSDSGAGWAVAVIILVAVILVGLFVWPGFARRSAPVQQAPGANINVTLPSGSTEGTNPGQNAPAQ